MLLLHVYLQFRHGTIQGDKTARDYVMQVMASLHIISEQCGEFLYPM